MKIDIVCFFSMRHYYRRFEEEEEKYNLINKSSYAWQFTFNKFMNNSRLATHTDNFLTGNRMEKVFNCDCSSAHQL